MQPGDRIKLQTDQESIEGTLMPEQQGYTVIKLDSGYNLAFRKTKVRTISIVEKKKETKRVMPKLKQQANLPKISIIHTGGTIASKVDYTTGGVIAQFSPEELLEMFPELKDLANIDSMLLRNMFSEDLGPDHWNLIADAVAKALKKSEGVIVTHGTDTMHFSSAALSFILQGLEKPVIFVGAQRSSDRASTDGKLNLLAAVQVITQTQWAGVSICMHENENDDVCVLLPGTQTRKMHSSRRDAFKPINAKPIARIRPKNKSITFTDEYKKRGNKQPTVQKMHNPKIAMLLVYPGLTADMITHHKDKDGLVLVGTGLGHVPVNKIDEFTEENLKILASLKELTKKTVVVMTTATIYGETNMNVYESGRKLQQAGVIGANHRMPPETAYVKLAWLLSNYPKEKVKELFEKNLVGENPDRL